MVARRQKEGRHYQQHHQHHHLHHHQHHNHPSPNHLNINYVFSTCIIYSRYMYIKYANGYMLLYVYVYSFVYVDGEIIVDVDVYIYI